jgi:hypothetical protein
MKNRKNAEFEVRALPWTFDMKPDKLEKTSLMYMYSHTYHKTVLMTPAEAFSPVRNDAHPQPAHRHGNKTTRKFQVGDRVRKFVYPKGVFKKEGQKWDSNISESDLHSTDGVCGQ